MKILFAASEVYPLIKTGGLGDVVYSLSDSLQSMGDDVRLVLPAYTEVMSSVYDIEVVGVIDVLGGGAELYQANILKVESDKINLVMYLVDIPALYSRVGNPYVQPDGSGWHDNAERFTVFSRAVAQIASGAIDNQWKPDVVHCHDWQTGMIPAFLKLEKSSKPRVIFTVHNLAYDGLFSWDEFNRLGLPDAWWDPDYLEFYGEFSMLKSGLIFSDYVTTVSPTYAKQICTPEYGYRYEGILQSLGDKLIGILNGIDLATWNPRTDTHITQNYSVNYRRISAKSVNKTSLLKKAKLANTKAPLLGFVGRLVEQKGIDLIADILPRLFEDTQAAMIILGSGDKGIETQLEKLAKSYPKRLHVYIGYSEDLAHQIEAGCDLFIMPSRFEPCGLNQMYSLRYGTPPVVNYTGGLADSVIDTTLETIKDGTANGFVIEELDAKSLLATIKRALAIFTKPRLWQQICRTAMNQELGWESSARHYRKLYQN